MREYSFAALINKTKNRYLATHLPFVVIESKGEIVLYSNRAKANPQWVNLMMKKYLKFYRKPIHKSHKNYMKIL
jgi:predicted FMN-binding regulatory protein PaiB